MISPEVLRRFSLFAGLDPAVFKDLAMAGEEVSLPEGGVLFAEGDMADALYLIAEGSVELKINMDEAGTRQFGLQTLVEGDVVGWSALVEPYHYTLGAEASSDVRLVRLDADMLHEMMDDDPKLAYTLMHRLAQALGERLTNLRVQFVSLVV